MAWRYHQRSGDLFDPKGHFRVRGYSGFGLGKNNPVEEAVAGIGPIPCGRWKMTAMRANGGSVGPYAIFLEPVGHNAHGRSLFRVHGDSVSAPGTASHGCIILPRSLRLEMWASADNEIEVVP